MSKLIKAITADENNANEFSECYQKGLKDSVTKSLFVKPGQICKFLLDCPGSPGFLKFFSILPWTLMYFLQLVSILPWTDPFKPGQSSLKPGPWSLYLKMKVFSLNIIN